ncbi:MAG: hypothetical protein PWP08_1777 [Methanofollis sp.]|nr:hypothetical protein [Methanofollis sp.]
MKPNTYWIVLLLTAVAVGIVVGMAIFSGNVGLAIAAMAAGVAFTFIGRRFLDRVVEDERSVQISGQASMRTLEIAIVAGLVLATALLATAGSGPGLMSNQYANGTVDLSFFQTNSDGGIAVLDSHRVNLSGKQTLDDFFAFHRFISGGEEPAAYAGLIGYETMWAVFLMIGLYGALYLYYSRKYGS